MAPQVVVEILSPGNTRREMANKRAFYERYGAQEYYVYDPDRGTLEVWQRAGDVLQQVTHAGTWRSALLGIRLRLETDGELSVFRPDGRKFMRPSEIDERAEHERQRAEHAEWISQRFAAKLRELGIDPETLTE